MVGNLSFGESDVKLPPHVLIVVLRHCSPCVGVPPSLVAGGLAARATRVEAMALDSMVAESVYQVV